MPEDNSDDAGRSFNRRRILGMLGGGTAAVAGGVSAVRADPGDGKGDPREADPGKGVGPCTCGTCSDGYACGNVDGSPQMKTYTFSEAGEEYSVTIEALKRDADGRVIGFSYSTTDDINKVCIEGGPETVTYGPNQLTYGPDERNMVRTKPNPFGQQPEISDFSFCGAPLANYQIDLVKGSDVICGEQLGGSELYRERLLAVLAVDQNGTVYQSNTVRDADDNLDLEENPIEFETDRTATVDLEAIDSGVGDGDEYALAAYEFRDPGVGRFDEDEDDGEVNEVLRACDTVTGAAELRIDIDAGGCSACE